MSETEIVLSAAEVQNLDADALRERCAGLPFPCANNVEFLIEHLREHPRLGAVRLRLMTATIEPVAEEAK